MLESPSNRAPPRAAASDVEKWNVIRKGGERLGGQADQHYRQDRHGGLSEANNRASGRNSENNIEKRINRKNVANTDVQIRVHGGRHVDNRGDGHAADRPGVGPRRQEEPENRGKRYGDENRQGSFKQHGQWEVVPPAADAHVAHEKSCAAEGVARGEEEAAQKFMREKMVCVGPKDEPHGWIYLPLGQPLADLLGRGVAVNVVVHHHATGGVMEDGGVHVRQIVLGREISEAVAPPDQTPANEDDAKPDDGGGDDSAS